MSGDDEVPSRGNEDGVVRSHSRSVEVKGNFSGEVKRKQQTVGREG